MLRAYSLSERRQFDVLLGYPHLVQFLLILQNKLFYQGLSLWREFSFHDFTRFDQERGIKILRDCMNVRWIMLFIPQVHDDDDSVKMTDCRHAYTSAFVCNPIIGDKSPNCQP